MRKRDLEFAEFFSATWSRVYRTTYAVAGDRPRTEDALQTAYAQAYAAWRRVSKTDNPEAYLCRMAINAALTAHRKASSRRERPVPDSELLDSAAAVSLAPVDDDPIDEEMWDAVLRLPPRQRAVMVLRYREDLSEKEIADLLGMRTGTVKSHAATALATLRRELNDSSMKQEI